MHRTIRIGLLVIGLAGALATTPAVAQGPNAQRGEKEFRHAIQQIEHARDELQRAPGPDDRRGTPQPRNERWPSDYLGHRSRAIDQLNMAIKELQQGLVNDGRGRKDDKEDDKKGRK
jgi:hypothetical protein